MVDLIVMRKNGSSITAEDIFGANQEPRKFSVLESHILYDPNNSYKNELVKINQFVNIISRKSGQKIPKIANLQYYKSKANYGTKKKGISR